MLLKFDYCKGIKAKDLLKQAGINFEQISGLEDFCNEEAEYRVEMWEYQNGNINDDDLREEIIEELAERLVNDNHIIDYKTVYRLTGELMEEYFDRINKTSKAEEETMMYYDAI